MANEIFTGPIDPNAPRSFRIQGQEREPGFFERNSIGQLTRGEPVTAVDSFVGPREQSSLDKLKGLFSGLSFDGDKLKEGLSSPSGRGGLDSLVALADAAAVDPLVQSSIATAGFSGGDPLKSFLTTGSGRLQSVPANLAESRLTAKKQREDDFNKRLKRAFLDKLSKEEI